MTNQHRTQYRHPKAHTVIPMTTPVFGKFFQHVHSRLQIRTNITVFPIEGTDDEADLEFQSMLHIFVSGCKALNALEMRIEEEIGSTSANKNISDQQSSDTDEADSAIERVIIKDPPEEIKSDSQEPTKSLRSDFSLLKRLVINHLQETFRVELTNERTNKFTRALMKSRLHLYEVEDTLACREIQTDENGLPTDAETTPIAVSMNVIRYAIETGTEVLHEGSFAFIPKAIDGEESNGLIGAFDGGHVKLAILPPSVIKMILACEERWLKQVESSIRSTYQQPAPAMGAQIQEHEESFDGPSSNAPTNESASHAEQPKGTTETSFPHFKLESDPEIKPDD